MQEWLPLEFFLLQFTWNGINHTHVGEQNMKILQLQSSEALGESIWLLSSYSNVTGTVGLGQERKSLRAAIGIAESDRIKQSQSTSTYAQYHDSRWRTFTDGNLSTSGSFSVSFTRHRPCLGYLFIMLTTCATMYSLRHGSWFCLENLKPKH